MAKRIITISRQFGGGGRLVGKRVAERLGIAYYDKDLLAKIAETSGLDPEYIAQYGEYATSTSRFLYNLELHSSFTGEAMIPIPDQLYVIQHNVVTELADKEPCVIVGRCADYILHERADSLHVFLHADAAVRADRVVRLYGEKTDDPVKLVEQVDARRKAYYDFYTNRAWGMAANYHLCLDSGVVSLDRCVDIVVDLAERD